METVLIDGRPVEVSRLTNAQVDEHWDRLESLCGRIGGADWPYGFPSKFLDYARRCGLIDLETAKELYFICVGLKVVD